MIAWWTHIKYWLWAAVAIGFGVLLLVLRGLMMKKTDPANAGFGGLPAAPGVIQAAADQAYENSIAVRAATKATTDAQKAQLADIGKMDDAKARRKALADFLTS